jgi:hypothetical protein
MLPTILVLQPLVLARDSRRSCSRTHREQPTFNLATSISLEATNNELDRELSHIAARRRHRHRRNPLANCWLAVVELVQSHNNTTITTTTTCYHCRSSNLSLRAYLSINLSIYLSLPNPPSSNYQLQQRREHRDSRD